MSKPTYTIKKINPNGTEYDIVPTMITDDTGTYKAELPALSKDETIGLEPQVIHTLMSVSYATGSYTSTVSGRRSVRWYVDNVDGITTPYDGMKIAVKVPTPGLGTVGVVFSMNGNVVADYHPVAYNTALMTTQYAAGVIKMFTYDTAATLTPYVTQGTAASVTGVWKCEGDYNTNSTGYLSYTATAVSSGSTVHYIVSKRVAAANGTNYYNSNIYYLGDGTLNAPTLSEGGVALTSKYVRVDTNAQGLTDAQKGNARTNIEAESKPFIAVAGTDFTDSSSELLNLSNDFKDALKEHKDIILQGFLAEGQLTNTEIKIHYKDKAIIEGTTILLYEGFISLFTNIIAKFQVIINSSNEVTNVEYNYIDIPAGLLWGNGGTDTSYFTLYDGDAGSIGQGIYCSDVVNNGLPIFDSSKENNVLSVNSSGELVWRAYYNEELAD